MQREKHCWANTLHSTYTIHGSKNTENLKPSLSRLEEILYSIQWYMSGLWVQICACPNARHIPLHPLQYTVVTGSDFMRRFRLLLDNLGIDSLYV